MGDHMRTASINTAVSTVLEAEPERPVRCAKFRRQEMWAYKPVWSPTVVAAMYLVVALILIPLGVVIYTQSARLMETPLLRYDDHAVCSAEARINGTLNTPSTCLIAVNIPRNTTGKVYLYYGLHNFYQNARRYAESRSYDQLRGTSKPNTGNCKVVPAIDTVPCGLAAFSRFNDSFTFCRDQPCDASNRVNVSGENIAWNIDRTFIFNGSSRYTPEQNEIIRSEEFMVWMRLAPYRTWFKLHRRILEPLQARTYYMYITSNYPVQSFSGQKFFYLAETTWFGGPNRFLGLASLVVGAFALLFAVAYGVGSRFAPEPQLPPETKLFWAEGVDNANDSPHHSK